MAYPSPQRVFDMLGYHYRDCVTRVEGVAVAVVFDLYGNVQAVLNQGKDEHGKIGESYGFDVSRLERLPSSARVMELPSRPNYQSSIDMLGYRYRDRVSGAEGVTTQVSFDLFGCTELALHTGLDDHGVPTLPYCYDISRLERLSDTRVMEPPAIGTADPTAHDHGPAHKPAPSR